MKETSLQGSDIFAVQTLYDGSWRSDRKFISERQAQIYVSLLIGDWGRQRVRLLLGKYDVVCDHRRYSPIAIVPPKSKLAQMVEDLTSNIKNLFLNKKKTLVFGTISVLAIMVSVSAITSYPSLASNKQLDQSNHVIAQAEAPIAKDIRVVFMGLLKGQFSQLVTLKEAPVRLHGDWSEFCPSGIQDIQISRNSFTEFDGAIATDRELQAVFQAGQTYGLVGTDGVIHIIEMTGIDLVKPIGKISTLGVFKSDADMVVLKRCL
ncbi:MAG: hypothetical protein JKY12_06425 [Sneathiella sp.]|nr:hypothetical protein [Sneathiella sp.]